MSRKVLRVDVFKQISNLGIEGVCWEWQGVYNEERRMPEFYCEGRKQAPYRIVWELVAGEDIPQGQIILHSCDNRRCCNPAHMKLGTVAENNAEAEERERHGMPHHVVRAIRKLLDEGIPQKEIAKRYGISREAVSAVSTRRNHKRTGDDDEISEA